MYLLPIHTELISNIVVINLLQCHGIVLLLSDLLTKSLLLRFLCRSKEGDVAEFKNPAVSTVEIECKDIPQKFESTEI